MKKPLHPQKTPKRKSQHKNGTKNFNYIKITDRLRTVSWSVDGNPTGVVKPVYGILTFSLIAKAV